MSAVISPSSVREPTPCSRDVQEAAGLACLVETPVQLVTWTREVNPAVSRFAREVLVRAPFEIREAIPKEAVESFDPVPGFARAADPGAAEAFAEDVRFVLGLFFELTAARAVGVRLARLHEAMCPRFHADFIPVRLLFTYAGTGTEWLADQDVDRSYLGARSNGAPDEQSGPLEPGASVRRVPELTVALLKGAAWPGNEAKGTVHRSPALAEGERRILLSLDVLD